MFQFQMHISFIASKKSSIESNLGLIILMGYGLVFSTWYQNGYNIISQSTGVYGMFVINLNC